MGNTKTKVSQKVGRICWKQPAIPLFDLGKLEINVKMMMMIMQEIDKNETEQGSRTVGSCGIYAKGCW